MSILILCGAASATSTISANGKVIDVKYNFVQSHYNYEYPVTKGNGPCGYGYYGSLLVSGKDNKGISLIFVMNSFNKYTKNFQFKDVVNSGVKRIGPNGASIISITHLASHYQFKSTMNGRINSTLTTTGTGFATLTYINGQRLLKNKVFTYKFYQKGVYYGKMISSTIYTYKKFGTTYETFKQTCTSNTFYANGDTRQSIITTNYNRNTKGVLIGQKTSGKSSGVDKINNKKVNYTGVITIGTKYDPNDQLDEKFTEGNYHESITSTATKLPKRMPFEAL